MSCTLINTKDLVAYSGFRRVAENITPATQGELTTAIRDLLVAAGWTLLTTGSDSFGPSYSLLSCQVPWFNPSSIPAWYENQLHLTFRNTVNGTINVFPAAWDGSVAYMQAANPVFISFSGVTSDWTIHACPYQLVVWNNVSPRTLGGSQPKRQFIGAALNIPKFGQELGTRNMLFAANSLFNATGQSHLQVEGFNGVHWSAHNLVNGADITWSGTANNEQAMQLLLFTGLSRDGNRTAALWDQTLDPTMADPEDWQPLIQPAYLCYPLASPSGTLTINGFFWDTLIFNRWADWLAEATILSSRWLNLFRGDNSNLPGSSFPMQGSFLLLMDEVGV